jgi:hypothetical protein
LDFVFPVERQLLAKKKILGNQSSSRTETQVNETRSAARQISKNAKCRPNQPKEALINPIINGALIGPGISEPG